MKVMVEVEVEEIAEQILKQLAESGDVIQVVRCKDCEHSYEDIGGLWCSYGICFGCIVEDEWFCADGKRRTDDVQKTD